MTRQVARARTEGVLSASAKSSPPDSHATPEPAPERIALAEPAAAVPEPPSSASAPAPTPTPIPAQPDGLAETPAVAEPAILASATVVAAAAPAAAQAARPYSIPGAIRLYFDANGKRGRLDYKAPGSMIWLPDGASYEMRMEMGDWIIGKRVLSSSGRITSGGLAPSRFSDKFRSERAAHFDRQAGRITFSANTPNADLMPGAQDQLSIFAQLASMVGGDPLSFPVATQLSIQTAGPREAEPWMFTVEKEELLYLPGGQVPTLKLVRKPNQNYGQTVELWLAPQLAYLPARIRISFENGDVLDQQWKSSGPP